MKKNQWRTCGFLAAVCLAMTLVDEHSAFGQLSTASVTGVVRDSASTAIPSAEVVLKNANNGVSRKSVSNESGVYVFLNVQPGEYTLEASKDGFAPKTYSAFPLAVNQTAQLDFSLTVGTLQQSVTVAAEGTEVQSSTAELGAVVTQRQVVDLPLNGRNFTQLLTLTPGAVPVNPSMNSGGVQSMPIGAFIFPAINGQPNRSNLYLLDGINNQGAFYSTYAVPPIVDAMQEFKVQSHNDQAEFGGVMGGVVNVVTRSGTNDLHGAAWEFLRNDKLDARPYFSRTRPTFRQNMFGITAGGPVILPKLVNGRDKLFFFGGFQGFEYRAPSQTLYRVPTAANLAGDLSDEPPIFDPATTRANPAAPGTFIRDPFAGNRIPANRIDNGMLQYARTLVSAPINTGVPGFNGLDATPQKRSQREYTAKIDYAASQKDALWFRWSATDQPFVNSRSREQFENITNMKAYNFGASWVRTFSPTSVMQGQLGRVTLEQKQDVRYRDVPSGFNDQVGFSSQYASGFLGGRTLVPGMVVTGFFAGSELVTTQRATDVWEYRANFTKIAGRHILKAGGALTTSGWFSPFSNVDAGFTNVVTSNLVNTATTGSALASYLLALPDRANRRDAISSLGWGGLMSFYVQDQWKVTPRLTVNLGLRNDTAFVPVFGRPEDNNQFVGNIDFNRGVYVLQRQPPACSATVFAPCIPGGTLPANVVLSENGRFYSFPKLNLQPRVGLAYRLNEKTALRAGFGLVGDFWSAVNQYAQNFQGLWPSVGTLQAVNLNNPTPAVPFPNVRAQNPLPSGLNPAATPFNQVAWYAAPDVKNPYSIQWNAGFQRQFGGTTTLGVDYVGSGSRRLDMNGFYNTALTPGPGAPQSRSLFPHIAPTRYARSWGRSSYHSLQALLNKRFSGGLAAMVSYTWSKSIDLGCSGWFNLEGCSIQDPYNFNNDRSVSAFDIPQLLTMNAIYELPFGKGKKMSAGNRAVDLLIGGWQANAIVLLRTGAPYTINVNGDIANVGNASGYMRPNLVGNPATANRTTSEWFNRAAFAVPAQFTFGNLGRNTMRSDNLANLDLSVFRNFRITERVALEFRAESFNATNSPTFAAPGSNMSTPTFGQVSSTASTARQYQFALKLKY
jgi:hypothetical protein